MPSKVQPRSFGTSIPGLKPSCRRAAKRLCRRTVHLCRCVAPSRNGSKLDTKSTREVRSGTSRPGGMGQLTSRPKRGRVRSVPLVIAWPAQAAGRGLFKRHLRAERQVLVDLA